MSWFPLLLLLAVVALPASAANYPCSGKKGGVSHCSGALFVCNDGSISGSKRNCSAETGGSASLRALVQQPGESTVPAGACSCRSGGVCTGPRGGRYCTTDAGQKSYLRR